MTMLLVLIFMTVFIPGADAETNEEETDKEKCEAAYNQLKTWYYSINYADRSISYKETSEIEKIMYINTPEDLEALSNTGLQTDDLGVLKLYLQNIIFFCKDNEFSPKAALLAGKISWIDGKYLEAFYLQMNAIDTISEKPAPVYESTFEEIIDKVTKIFMYFIGIETEEEKYYYLKEQALTDGLNSLYYLGSCRAYNSLLEKNIDILTNLNEDLRETIFIRYNECIQFVESNVFDETIFGQSYSKYMLNAVDSGNLKKTPDKKIDLIVFNDYGITKEHLREILNSVKDNVIGIAPSYEFFGSSEYKSGQHITITTRYLDLKKPLCIQEEPEKTCDCEDFNKVFETITKISGADAVALITPVDCRSYAVSGKYSVISWTRPQGENLDVTFNIGGKAEKFEYLDEYVFLHELSHLIFLLEDEYYEQNAETGSYGVPNCASRMVEAEEWWGSMIGLYANYQDNLKIQEYVGDVGFYEGCGYLKKQFKPTFNSIMNSHYSYSKSPRLPPLYGPVNDKFMKNLVQNYEELIPVIEK